MQTDMTKLIGAFGTMRKGLKIDFPCAELKRRHEDVFGSSGIAP
jgi:hypothetical protein